MWESRFTGRIKATIIRNALSHSSSSLLHPTLSTAIYSTWPLALHGTTRNEFSVWSHMNKGIERKDKLVITIFCSLCKKQTGFLKNFFCWIKTHVRAEAADVPEFLSHCSYFFRWTLGQLFHKNILSFCKYPVQTDKREFDMVNVMPLSVVHIPSFQPIRTALTLWCQVLKLTVSFFSTINRN